MVNAMCIQSISCLRPKQKSNDLTWVRSLTDCYNAFHKTNLSGALWLAFLPHLAIKGVLFAYFLDLLI